MHLLELPTELVDVILEWCVRVRCLKRALRLRLVNHLFSVRVIAAICRTCKLDDSNIYIDAWPLFPHYLEQRILMERGCTFPHLADIRKIAQLTSAENNFDDVGSEASFRRDLSQLCRAVHIGAAGGMSRLFATDVPEDEDWENSDFQHDLAAAAALLNRPALLKRVLEESCDLEVRPGRLPPPYISAAQAGHHEILDLLFGQKESFFHLRRQRAFTAAAESGRAQTVKYILKAPWIPWSLEDPKTRDSQALKEGLCTPDMDTFNIILEARQNTPQKGPLDEYELHRLLLNAVRKGWTFMARHLLWLGAPIDVPLYERDKGDFVLYACKGGFGDTVRLLLDHGAHATGGALRMAADCGYSDIVRMLLEHGVKAEGLVAAAARKGHLPTVQTLTEHGQNLDEGLGPETVWGFEPPAIVWAVELEHERMFRYLVTQGARIDTDESGGEAVRRAKNAGLESMLTLLEEYGVDRRTDLPSGDQVKKSLQE